MKNNVNWIGYLVIAILLHISSAIAKTEPIKNSSNLKSKAAALEKGLKGKPQTSLESFENVITYPMASKIAVAAKQAIVVDYNTGKVLLEKNADERMPPSSMTKMATTYIIEERLIKGEINADTEFKVSEKAWRTQGSKMFVQLGGNIRVADLHKGIAIQSGNDASIVAAEGIMGTEAGFAIEMNRIAKELGMNNTNFKNASGLPDEDHYSTARDLSKLAAATIKNHMKYYHINQELEFTYNGIKQGNRNPLLYDHIGCDGLKTGHTDKGGFGVTASCLDGGQRYIIVINGMPSVQARANEARKLVGWAKGNFIGKILAKKGEMIEKAAKIKDGVKDTVALVAAEDVYMLMLRTEQSQVKLTPFVNELTAPIKENQRAGTLIASAGESRIEIELQAKESVEEVGWLKKMLNEFKGALNKYGII
jgi:serine-type D-Ala-D-Ala carboxypeptidase (penicillin-binding protein 5/6)